LVSATQGLLMGMPGRFLSVRSWSVISLGLLLGPVSDICFAEDWADLRAAGPFVCRADFSLQGSEALLDDLAQLQEDLVRVLGIPAPQEHIEIYLFRNEADYRHYLNKFLSDVPYRRALYIKRGGPGVVLAYASKELATDLRHECTHALLHAVLPMVPLWLDEGLAEFFEVSPQDRPYGSPHLTKVRWNAKFGVKTAIEKLEKKGEVTEMGSAEYRDAWAWVHYMLYGSRDAHGELVLYLRDIAGNVPPGSLGARLAQRIPGLEQEYLSHFRGWTPRR